VTRELLWHLVGYAASAVVIAIVVARLLGHH
jgi:hypothetical protein